MRASPRSRWTCAGRKARALIGYLLQQNLQNELFRRSIKQNVATVITQVLVDTNDPAFQHPTKPIGGFMEEAEAKHKANDLGWTVVEDAGRGWRRVVASPDPKDVVEIDTVKALIKAGVIVITVGGGGIPVIDAGEGNYIGTAAVIDKDYASSLLAQEINADLFVISTAVEKVALNLRQAQPGVARPDHRGGSQAVYGRRATSPKAQWLPKIHGHPALPGKGRQASPDHQP